MAQVGIVEALEDYLGYELHVLRGVKVWVAGVLVSFAKILGLCTILLLIMKSLDDIVLLEEELELKAQGGKVSYGSPLLDEQQKFEGSDHVPCTGAPRCMSASRSDAETMAGL